MKEEEVFKTIQVLALASITAYWIFHAGWLLIIAAILLASGIFVSRLAQVIARGWLYFARFLGTVNTKILLSIVYYVFLTPIALLRRFINKEFVHYFRKRHSSTYYHDVNTNYDRKSFEKMW